MVNKTHGISQDEARENMLIELRSFDNYMITRGCLSSFMGYSGGTEIEDIPFFEGIYELAARGEGLTVSYDSGLLFPDEIADYNGGVAAQYGFIEFDILVGFDHIPFDEAYELIALTVKHYLAFRPDREARVTELMAQARKSFDRLQKNHDRWKRQNS